MTTARLEVSQILDHLSNRIAWAMYFPKHQKLTSHTESDAELSSLHHYPTANPPMLQLPWAVLHEKPAMATQHAGNISRRSMTAHTARLERRLQAHRQDGKGQAVQLRSRTISRLDGALVYWPIKHHIPPYVETRLGNEIRFPARTDDATGDGRSTQDPKRRHPITHACESARGAKAMCYRPGKGYGNGRVKGGTKERNGVLTCQ